jgi:hypothetical protein
MVARTSSSRRRRRGVATVAVAASATLIVAGLVAITMLTRPTTAGLAPTGETNDMGLPVVTTPGDGTGEASAGDLRVTGAKWALGTVPLNVSVQPTWTLVNTGDDTIRLGEPHAEIREGCCPGPLTLGERTLAAGAATTLTFDLAMHEGMDGWHDIAVHVPVEESTKPLTVEVTGNFGNG